MRHPETGVSEPLGSSTVCALFFGLQGFNGSVRDLHIGMEISIALSQSRAGHLERYHQVKYSFPTELRKVNEREKSLYSHYALRLDV